MQQLDKTIFGLSVVAFMVYVLSTGARYGLGAGFAGVFFLLLLKLHDWPERAFTFMHTAHIDAYGRHVVTAVAAAFIILFVHSVIQNPYRHMIMTGDAVQHIQWPIALTQEWTAKIAAFSWPQPPEEMRTDPVFGYAFLDRSAYVFYYYGYFLSGLIVSLFYILFPVVGHHILVIACVIYSIGTYAIFKYLKTLKLKTPTIVMFSLLWAANPMMIIGIFNGGRYEFMGFAFLPLFFLSILQKRIGLILFSSILLAGMSRFFCYYLLAACVIHFLIYRQYRTFFALCIPALFFLVISTLGFNASIAGNPSSGEILSLSPTLNMQLNQLLIALLFNVDLLVFLFAYTGFVSLWAFRKIEDRKYALFLVAMLAIGLATLLVRSYEVAFTRNCVIIIPVFYLAALGWRNIASERMQMMAVPVFLLLLTTLGTLTWKWDGPNMLYHWKQPDHVHTEVNNIRECSQFLDGAVAGKHTIAVSAPRSLEGAFLGQPNRWFFDWRQKNTDSFAVIEIEGENHMSPDYRQIIEAYLDERKIKKSHHLTNSLCSVSVYETVY
jgi:hypothetical protein